MNMLHVFVLGDTQPVEVRKSGENVENGCPKGLQRMLARKQELAVLVDGNYTAKTSRNAEKGNVSSRDFICLCCLTGVWPSHPPKSWPAEQDLLCISLSICCVDQRRKEFGGGLGKAMKMGLERRQKAVYDNFIQLA